MKLPRQLPWLLVLTTVLWVAATHAADYKITLDHAQATADTKAWATELLNEDGATVLTDSAEREKDKKYCKTMNSRLSPLLKKLCAKTAWPDPSEWEIIYYRGGRKWKCNAFSAGSRVLGYSYELFQLAKADGELAAVLAHEMSHDQNGVVDLKIDGNSSGGKIGRSERPDWQQIEEQSADVLGTFLLRDAGFPAGSAVNWHDHSPEHGAWDAGMRRVHMLGRFGKTKQVKLEKKFEAHGTWPQRRDWLVAARDFALPADNGCSKIIGMDRDFNIYQPVVARWNALFGSAPTDVSRDMQWWPFDNTGGVFMHGWGQGDCQDFIKRDGSQGCIMLKDGATTAYWVHGAIWATYASRGGPDKFGYPIGEEYDVAAGRAQKFEKGVLVWNRSTGLTTEGGVGITADGRGTGFPGTGDRDEVKDVPVDLIFCIDATGSMWDDIEQVKANAAELIRTTRMKCPDLRLGLVTYRDFSVDGDRHLETVLPLTTDYASVEDAIQKITVSGGGDAAEDVLDGLKAALDMEWRAGVVKLITLLGDAPAKDPDHAGNTTASICKYAEELDPVHVYSLACGGASEGSPAWESLAAISVGTGATISGVEDVEILTDSLMETIAKAVETHKAEAGASWSGGGGGGGEDDILSAVLLMSGIVVTLLLAVVVQRRRTIPLPPVPPPVRLHVLWQIRATGPFGRRAWSYRDMGPITVGRAPDSMVRLDDPQVSAQHLTLRPLPHAWLLVDLGSSNGTFVNSRRVERTEIRGGETIQIGDTRLELQRVGRAERQGTLNA